MVDETRQICPMLLLRVVPQPNGNRPPAPVDKGCVVPPIRPPLREGHRLLLKSSRLPECTRIDSRLSNSRMAAGVVLTAGLRAPHNLKRRLPLHLVLVAHLDHPLGRHPFPAARPPVQDLGESEEEATNDLPASTICCNSLAAHRTVEAPVPRSVAEAPIDKQMHLLRPADNLLPWVQPTMADGLARSKTSLTF